VGASLRGLFLADFSDFVRECEKATTRLVDFASGADKVGPRLNAMVDNFSGKKVIQDATLMAEAVERVGGVSKLTEAELARVSKTAKEAADKMVAMGVDVPPGIQKIANEAKDADKAHGGMLDTVKNLALGFAAMFTVRAAFNFVKDVLTDASALADLSTQTHINVEDLQTLAGAMSEFGVDADTLGKGLYKLSKGIAGEDASVSHGLHLMGMSLKDVEGLNGRELFLKIEDGLATLQGGLRDTAAAELFGGRLGAAMAGASEDIKGTIEKWERLNHVASAESVAAMDEFGESIARAEKNMSSIAANMIGPLAEGFNVLYDAATKGASKWELFLGLLPKGLGLVGTGTEGLATAIDHLNKKQDENTEAAKRSALGHGETVKAIDTRTKAEQFMAALEKDAAGELTAAQLTNLGHLKEIGKLTSENALGVGVTTGQFAKYMADQAAALKIREKATQDAAKATTEWDGIEKLFHAQAMKHFKEQETEQARVLKLRNKTVVDGNAEIMALSDKLHDYEMKTSMDTATYQIMKIYEKAEAEIRAFSGTEQQIEKHTDLVYRMADIEARGITDVMATAVDRMAAKAEEGLDKVVSKAQAASYSINSIFSVGGSSSDMEARARSMGGTIAYDDYNNPYVYIPGVNQPGHRAGGGPVAAGESYIVGERGPELFVPASAGSITPNGGGGASIVNHIYVNGTAADVARQVAAEIMRTVKAGQQLGSA